VTESNDRIKLTVFRAFVIIVFLVLSFQLWRLQITKGQEYTAQAELNRFRLVSTPPLRGIIYDRWGTILARNAASYAVTITPADLPAAEDTEARERIFTELGQLLDMPAFPTGGGTVLPDRLTRPIEPSSIADAVEQGELNPFEPIYLKRNVDRDTAFIIEEQHLNLPGVQVVADPVREYPTGSTTANILGYVGPIPAEQADELQDEGYNIYTDKIGLTGVEAVAEQYLRGTPGRKHVEVDIAGRELRTISDAIPAVPGDSVILSLDADLQQFTEEALQRTLDEWNVKQGAVVILNVKTGEVLTMVSLPSYDNNLFATGIDAKTYQDLLSDPQRPLVNFAISGQQPPGSSFKVITAAGALNEGVLTPSTTFRCDGSLLVPNKYFPDDPSMAQKFVCWWPWGHGDLNVIGGLAYSCDIFFYRTGGGFGDQEGLGVDRLAYYATQFGLGEKSGIDLPGEASGLVPNPTWKRLNYSESWVLGDTYNMSIGQGFVLATPLQMANLAATIANGGTLYQPQVVREVVDANGKVVVPFQPKVIRQLDLAPGVLDTVREGMRAAVSWGTAYRANMKTIAVAGKTGTAEFPGERDAEGHLPTHAWFISFAPYEDPELAMAIFIYGGGDRSTEGATVGAPLAKEIYSYYFQAQ
jgi:penicillin-binding protein 2